MAEPKQAKKTVAVVGSGMAGLVCAYLIQQDSKCRYEVEVFETQDRLSLDSASQTVLSVDGQTSVPNRIDIPMRAFDDGFHLNLKRMYDFLGVGYITQKFVYLLSRSTVDDDKKSPYFLHSSSNHQFPPIRLADRGFGKWIIQIIYLAVCYFWFTACCFVIKPEAASLSTEDESLGAYLKRIRLPQHFIKDYLLPLMSSVTTCPHDALLEFPAVDAIDYARRTYRQPHYRVIGGVQNVQAKLAKELVVNLSATVTTVESLGTKVLLSWVDANNQNQSSEFDHVIMAVTPDVVGAIYEPLREVMGSIPVVRGEAVIHRDTSAIIDCSESLNRLSAKTRESCSQSEIMYIHSDLAATESTHEQSSVMVTSFPITPIDPDKIIHRARLTRVLRTPKSRAIVNGIFDADQSGSPPSKNEVWRNGDGNVWLVGAWCWDGMVLLEGCVVSAMRVATNLGVEVPWTIPN